VINANEIVRQFDRTLLAEATSMEEERNVVNEMFGDLDGWANVQHAANQLGLEWNETIGEQQRAAEAAAAATAEQAAADAALAEQKGDLNAASMAELASLGDLDMQYGLLNSEVAANRQQVINLAEAYVDLAAEMDAVLGGTFNYEESTLNLSTTMRRFQDDVVAAYDVLADATATTSEKEAATDSLRLSEIGAAKAALETASAYAAEQGAAEGTIEYAALQREELERLRKKYPELKDEINLYIAELRKIPTSITTNLRTTQTGSIGRSSGGRGVRHTGGPVAAGETYDTLPGEIFTPSVAGRISSREDVARALGNSEGGEGGGGNTYILQYEGLVPPNEAVMQQFEQMVESIEAKREQAL
jgi:chromosome segregation ATPase